VTVLTAAADAVGDGGGWVVATIVAIAGLLTAMFGALYKFTESGASRLDTVTASQLQAYDDRADAAEADAARAREDAVRARREKADAYREADRWQTKWSEDTTRAATTIAELRVQVAVLRRKSG
jgi:type I site-specific restriction endonuclease